MATTIPVTRTTSPKAKPRDEELGFGRYFTDHMFLMDATADQGWHNPRVVPYGPLTLEPSAAVLHYSQEIFEGLKAYRSPRDTVLLFRPDKNAARLEPLVRANVYAENGRAFVPLSHQECGRD